MLGSQRGVVGDEEASSGCRRSARADSTVRALASTVPVVSRLYTASWSGERRVVRDEEGCGRGSRSRAATVCTAAGNSEHLHREILICCHLRAIASSVEVMASAA